MTAVCVVRSQTLPPNTPPIHEQVHRCAFGPLQSLHRPRRDPLLLHPSRTRDPPEKQLGIWKLVLEPGTQSDGQRAPSGWPSAVTTPDLTRGRGAEGHQPFLFGRPLGLHPAPFLWRIIAPRTALRAIQTIRSLSCHGFMSRLQRLFTLLSCSSRSSDRNAVQGHLKAPSFNSLLCYHFLPLLFSLF